MKEIFKDIVVFVVTSGLLTWLIKSLGDNFINKKFKAFEFELKQKSDNYKLELDKTLQAHKSDLDLGYIKASKLHDKRLTIISDLYKKIVVLDQNMRAMTAILKMVSADPKKADKEEIDRINSAGESYNDFHFFFRENKIFFSEDTCEIIEKLRQEYWESHHDYQFQHDHASDPKFDRDLAQKAWNKVKDDVPKTLKKLESDFRQTLNVLE